MKNQDHTNQELLEELARLQRRAAELETQLARTQQAEADRQQASDGLRESNEELSIFKAFVEAATQGCGMADMDGRIVYGNAALARLVGEDKPENSYGKQPLTYYTDDYQKLQETTIFPILERDGAWQGELTMLSSTGEHIPVLQTSFTLVDKHKTPVGRGVVITDLREVKRVERSLRDSIAELQAIYNGMIDGFNIFDMDTLKTFRANSALCEMMGYSEEELKALPVEKAHPPEDLPWILERAEEHAAGHVSRSENIPVMRRDGTVFYADVSSSPIDYKGRRCVMSFFHDITERREAEEELRRSEARYKALVESSPDAIVMFDLEGRIIFASPQAAERHRVEEASDLIGRSVIDLVVESDRELMKSNIQRLLKSGIRRNDEYTGLLPDGTTFFGEVSASVINDLSGKPEALMAVYRDITDRKEAQEALQKERESLRRMLRASDRDRELISCEIHDGIAQRLLGSLMHFEAVLQVDHGLTEDARVRFDIGLAALRQASTEARSLINRTRTPVLEEFGVAEAITEFIGQFCKMPDMPEIICSCDAQFKRLEPVLESTIFRVVQEAVTNACIHSKSEIVRVTLSQRGENVTVDVQDSGIGFDPANISDNRFGLHSIRERTRLLGKDLKIESTPGQGTRIRATFPLIVRKKQAD